MIPSMFFCMQISHLVIITKEVLLTQRQVKFLKIRVSVANNLFTRLKFYQVYMKQFSKTKTPKGNNLLKKDLTLYGYKHALKLLF